MAADRREGSDITFGWLRNQAEIDEEAFRLSDIWPIEANVRDVVDSDDGRPGSRQPLVEFARHAAVSAASILPEQDPKPMER